MTQYDSSPLIAINAGSTKVSIILRHPTRRAEDIARMLNADLDIARSAGEPRVMNANTTLPGVFAETYCAIDLPDLGTANIADAVRSFLDWAKSREPSLIALSIEGGSTSIMATIEPVETFAVALPFDLMTRLGELHVNLEANVLRR